MLLAIDASTSVGTVALFNGSTLLAERAVHMRGAAEERLMPAIVDAVESNGSWQIIDRIVVGRGPGSFTSLRVAGSIAKGLATSLGVELWTVSSLALIVAQAPLAVLGPGRYLASLDAMRGEYFTLGLDVARDGRLTLVGGGARVPAATLAAHAGERGAALVGPTGPVSIVQAPHARGVARLLASALGAPVDLERWEPDYGRLAEAQVKWEAEHGRRLQGAPR
ncbi:MAG: tRNA (adenosine(37)-N6)-threonylcarbamoyltransferase complex dimerization subunit type 1 TsaB [Gemmatimonadaceae bacterium]